jgi:hypothetical protein
MKTMHSIKLFILLITFTIIVVPGCQKSGTTPASPDDNVSSTDLGTKAQYNNTSSGVYKGVVIGSTGTIVFTINNGNNAIKGFLTIDNIRDTLTTVQTIVPGQPINNVTFTGRISSMKLSANADGSNATLSNISITGHSNVAILIIHENSTKQILCYEGNYSGSLSGTLNCARVGTNDGDTVYVLAQFNDTLKLQSYGKVINNNTTMNFGPVYSIQGSFSGNNFNGTWTHMAFGTGTIIDTGTFACTRTY